VCRPPCTCSFKYDLIVIVMMIIIIIIIIINNFSHNSTEWMSVYFSQNASDEGKGQAGH